MRFLMALRKSKRKERIQFLLACLVTMMVHGCAITRSDSGSPRRPAVVPDVSLSSPEEAAPGEALIQLVSWQEPAPASVESSATTASPLDLNSLIQQAFQSNPEVHLAQEGTRAAAAALRKARVEFNPLVTAATGYGVSDIPIRAFSYRLNQGQVLSPSSINRTDGEDDLYAQIGLQKDVYDGGKRAAQTRAAAALRGAAAHEVCSARNEVAFRVAQAYYRLLNANELLRVREQAVKQVEKHLQAVRTRRDVGSAVKSEELLVVVRLAEAQDAEVVAGNQVDLAWADLDRIVGTHVVRASLPAATPSAIEMAELEIMEAELLAAVQRRPEIARHRHEQSAAANQVRAAEAIYSPRVQLLGDYEVHTGDVTHGEDGFYFGMLASLNLFDGGRTTSAVAVANSALRQKRIEYERLRLDIEFEIRQARLNLNAATQRLTLAEKSVEEAAEVLRNVELQYRTESTTAVRLLDAQVLVAEARARNATAQADVEIARMDLARALGILHNRFS